MSPTEQQVVAGFGVAAFFLSIYQLADSINRGDRTMEEARKIISGARAFSREPENFRGDRIMLHCASRALDMAESVLAVASARSQCAEPN